MTVLERPAPAVGQRPDIRGRVGDRHRPKLIRPAVLRRIPHPFLPRPAQTTAVTPAEPVRPLAEPIDATRHLDPRVWMVWLAAVIIPALAGRNPFPLFALLIVVVVVRSAWAPALARDVGWSLILRFAIIAAVISIVFNVLTAPFGDQVLLSLPGWWPLGDVVTANALIYGLLSAVAVVVIILAGTTAGSLADWPELLRSVPARFLPLAVAGSVAWAFIPQTIGTLRDIRDAQRVREIGVASARTLVPIVVPLLATSLERATTMAEALESRGFGGPAMRSGASSRTSRARSLAAPIGLTLGVAGVYLLLDGSALTGIAVATAGTLLIAVALAVGGRDARSRYRNRIWRPRDSVILAASLTSLLTTGLTLTTGASALRYSPYPDIAIPVVGIPLIVALGLLLAPAIVAPLVPVRKPTVPGMLEPDVSESQASRTRGASGGGADLSSIRAQRAPAGLPADVPSAPQVPGDGSAPVQRGKFVHTMTSGTVRRTADRSPVTRARPWASWPPAIKTGPLSATRRRRSASNVEKRLVRY